jgi:DNA-directed RNA polymerase subunit F
MGDTEREFLEKIVSIKTKSSKKVVEVKDDFAKMQKLKAETLRKAEEMVQSAEHDLEKLEQAVVKSKDLVPESRQRLSAELAAAKEQITQKYGDLKKRISAAIVPE